MSADTSPAARLVAAVQLQEIRLAESTARSSIRSAEEVHRGALNINFSGRAESPVESGTFYVLAAIEAGVTPTGSEEPVVTIRATFELKYGVPADLAPSQEELRAFAETNGIFNAWPYWREYVQSVLTRMGLPPVTLPVFRLSDYRKQLRGVVEVEKESDAAAGVEGKR